MEHLELILVASLLISNTNIMNKVVDLLTNQKVVAFYYGRSEVGPRALGHRSLLFDPRNKDAKNIMNTIKNRESFRPFAASILEECANDWFEMRSLKSSPFMMYAIKVRQERKEIIPGVLHIDDTCRIQTVSEGLYYDLIKLFYMKTGVPLILNTSFNLNGQPIVETKEDAINTLQNSSIEYLYFAETDELLCVS